MSNAELIDLTGEPVFAASLARTIAGLLKLRGRKPQDAWRHLDISRGTWFNRMNDGHFTAHQMKRLADYLEVSVETLYEPSEDLLRSRCFSPLALVPPYEEPELFPETNPHIDPAEVSPSRTTLTLFTH